MKNLDLTANTEAEKRILGYLQNNASDTLADKINNGTPFVKDDRKLTNKKTLAGFMKHAASEARKLAEKGANSACVEDSVVFGWAIHYFEEDSIEEKLFTPDGQEYKPASKHIPTQKAQRSLPEQTAQPSLLDMIEKQNKILSVMESEPTVISNDTDELTEAEMREFDGDVKEPRFINNGVYDDESDYTAENDYAEDSPFDEDAVRKLKDFLGECFVCV